MAIALVSNVGTGGSMNGVTSGAIDTTGANLLVAAVSYYNTTLASISDSKGNTWTALTQRTNSTGRMRLFYSVPTSVGSGHTFTASVSGGYPAICIAAFSGAAASPFDQESGAGATSPGSITPSENNCLLVSGYGRGSSGSAGSASGGFSVFGDVNFSSGNYMGCSGAYLIQTTAAAANPTWLPNGNTPVSAMASFKAAAAGQPYTKRLGGLSLGWNQKGVW